MPENTDIQKNWGTLNLQDIFGEDLDKVIASLKSAVTFIVDVIQTISIFLEVAATVLGLSVNLLFATIQAVIAAIDAVIDFFVSTQISVTWVLPLSYRSGPTASENLQLIANSFYDISDPDRPTSLVGLTSSLQAVGTGSNYFAMAVMMASSPNLDDLIKAFEELFKLFNIPIPPYPEISLLHELGYPPTLLPGQGQKPDWMSMRLSDIGIIGDIVQYLISMRNSLAVLASGAEFLREIIQSILNRIAEFNRRLIQIEDLIKQYLDLIKISPSINVLSVFGKGTIAEQANQLLEAVSLESYPFTESRQLELTASYTMHIQSPDPTQINTFVELFRLARVSVDRVQELQEDQEARFNAVSSGKKVDEEQTPVGTTANQLKDPKTGFRE